MKLRNTIVFLIGIMLGVILFTAMLPNKASAAEDIVPCVIDPSIEVVCLTKREGDLVRMYCRTKTGHRFSVLAPQQGEI